MNNNSILSEMYKGLSFTQEEIASIESKFEKITFKKGDLILSVNEKVTHQYYVCNGCLRTYYIDSSGKEHTIQFAINDWWISDYIGYFSETESVLNIECIVNATLLKITKKDIETIYTQIPKTERFIRKKMERFIVSFQKRILANLSQSAKERYINFTKAYPNIEQQVKNYHIASYLGITTESLSRIRKEIIQL